MFWSSLIVFCLQTPFLSIQTMSECISLLMQIDRQESSAARGRFSSWRSMSDADDLSENTSMLDVDPSKSFGDSSMHGATKAQMGHALTSILNQSDVPRQQKAAKRRALEDQFRPIVKDHSRFLVNFVLTVKSNSNHKIRSEQVRSFPIEIQQLLLVLSLY